MLKGRAAIQVDTDRLEECADRNLMKFSREKCEVLSPPVMDLIHCYCSSWGTALLERTWDAGEQQPVRVPALQHGSNEGQQYPQLYQCQCRQQSKGSDYSTFIWHSLDHVWNIAFSFSPLITGKMLRNFSKPTDETSRWEHMPCGWEKWISSAWRRNGF